VVNRRAALLAVSTLLAMFSACDDILDIHDHGVASEAGAESGAEGSPGAGEGSVADATGGDAPSTSSGGEASGPEASASGPDATADGSGASIEGGTDAAMAHDAGPGSDANESGAGAACDGTPCTTEGPVMVPVTTYWVDSTEVTVGQYQQFLTAKGSDTSGQPAACAWNTSYAPTGTNPSNYPITSVDWCDAFAFCKWAGKHLCGAVGTGGPMASTDVLDAGVSQWFRACGGPGGSSDVNANPVCNANHGFNGLAAVATFPMCEGWYPGLFDLEGNAAEWVDSCDIEGGVGGASDTCYVLGGSYLDLTSYCTEYNGLARNFAADSVGFRCCHE
jgi:hypothetical protein